MFHWLLPVSALFPGQARPTQFKPKSDQEKSAGPRNDHRFCLTKGPPVTVLVLQMGITFCNFQRIHVWPQSIRACVLDLTPSTLQEQGARVQQRKRARPQAGLGRLASPPNHASFAAYALYAGSRAFCSGFRCSSHCQTSWLFANLLLRERARLRIRREAENQGKMPVNRQDAWASRPQKTRPAGT